MPPTFTDEGLRAAILVRDQWPDVGVLVLSQWVKERYATELIAARPHGVGYLLKDRVADVAELLDALQPGRRPAAAHSTPRSSPSSWPAAATPWATSARESARSSP